MEQETVKVRLNPDEWKLIAGLRDIPPSPLLELTHELMMALIDYVRDPHCPELQADGAPCETPAADCEECRKVKELLFTLRSGMARS
jgi:hypothetical protein